MSFTSPQEQVQKCIIPPLGRIHHAAKFLAISTAHQGGSERSLLAIKSARAGSSIYIEQPSSQTRHLLGFKPKNVPTLIALENLKRLTLEIPDFSGFCHFLSFH
jgi:hypothetical protein